LKEAITSLEECMSTYLETQLEHRGLPLLKKLGKYKWLNGKT